VTLGMLDDYDHERLYIRKTLYIYSSTKTTLLQTTILSTGQISHILHNGITDTSPSTPIEYVNNTIAALTMSQTLTYHFLFHRKSSPLVCPAQPYHCHPLNLPLQHLRPTREIPRPDPQLRNRHFNNAETPPRRQDPRNPHRSHDPIARQAGRNLHRTRAGIHIPDHRTCR